MADPLGLIGQGAGGVRGTTPGFAPRQAQPQTDASGASFKDVLMKNIEQVNQLQNEASAAQEDLVAGRRNDIESVLTATQKASEAFNMLLAVRNKVQAAYEEIKQVRI